MTNVMLFRVIRRGCDWYLLGGSLVFHRAGAWVWFRFDRRHEVDGAWITPSPRESRVTDACQRGRARTTSRRFRRSISEGVMGESNQPLATISFVALVPNR